MRKKKKKLFKNPPSKRRFIFAFASIVASFNNTLISISDLKGNVLASSSSGRCGFRGTRKKTPGGAKYAAENAARVAKSYGIKFIFVNLKGVGAGREAALRGLRGSGLYIMSIFDTTPVLHNGCRPPKPRRL
uniref:Small ribosomal subunit protein uS11c n=1 Tax=Prototheca cutis TaxID=575411 RepID=A0A2Z6BEQ6_9CHLO|nr:ribosomal protein s11 [Prototheca cutis]BBD20209.1 ribosomal protein s11 [Prototheca cutis]